MAKQGGLGDNFYVGGANVSGDVNSITGVHGGPAAWSVTDITESGYERLGLLRDGGMEWVSYFNPARAHLALSGLPTTDVVASYFRGAAIGNWAASCIGKQINYDPSRTSTGELTLKVQVLANGFGVEWGLQLTAGQRTDSAATNGTSLDGAAASTFGGQAYLNLTAFTGTSVTVKLQDSADNSTFADLSGAGFVASTAADQQRIAFTGTVRRYVRAVTTGTFSNAVFSVNFVRNGTLVTF